MKGVEVVTHNDLMLHLDNSYERLLPLFVWGTFGIGKSYMIREFGKKVAKERGLKYTENPFERGKDFFTVAIVSAHQLDAGGVQGLPFPDEDRKRTTFLLTKFLPEEKDSQGILFWDELNLAPQLIQNNCYSLIWDRGLPMLNYYLPKQWISIGAGNTVEDRAHIQEMPMPLKNRMGHVQLLPPTVAEWDANFASPAGIDQRITLFLYFREDYLLKFDTDIAEEQIAVPSPRTWEMASRAIKGIDNLEHVQKFVGRYVGASIGAEMKAWLNLSKKVNIDKVYKDGKVSVPSEPSEAFALMSAIIEYFAKKSKIAEEAPKVAETLLDLTYSFKKEHGVIILRQAMSACPKYFDLMKSSPTAKKKLVDAKTNYAHLITG